MFHSRQRTLVSGRGLLSYVQYFQTLQQNLYVSAFMAFIPYEQHLDTLTC